MVIAMYVPDQKVELCLEFSRHDWLEIEMSLLAGACALRGKKELPCKNILLELRRLVSEYALSADAVITEKKGGNDA